MAQSKYRQIFSELRKQLLEAKFDVSNPFPSETAVAREKKTTRNTVHRAFVELRRLGLIEGEPGVVPRVASHRISRKIGLIVPSAVDSEFFQPIVGEISRQSQEHGYTLLFGNITSKNPFRRAVQAKRFAEELVREGVAGVIYQPLELIDDTIRPNAEIVAIFDAANIPVVLIDYDIVPPPERSKYDLVGINNFQAGYLLANHLKSVGAKNVDFVMRPNCAWSVHGRLSGVRAALFADGKVASRTLVAEPDELAALRRHLKRGRPDAFVCGTDTVAAKFKQTLEKAGLKVPKDVLLAGFDDVQIAALLTPPLTTIRQPCKAIGAVAFKALLRRMFKPSSPAREIFLPAPLVVRESSKRRT